MFALRWTVCALLSFSVAFAAPFSVTLVATDPALACGSTLTPALTLSAPPAGTRSLAVVFWDQQPTKLTGRWLVYDLPTSTRTLPAGPNKATLAGGTVGVNDLGHARFEAPCDRGARDFYVDYYALNTAHLNVPTGASFRQIHALIHQHKLLEAKAHLRWTVK